MPRSSVLSSVLGWVRRTASISTDVGWKSVAETIRRGGSSSRPVVNNETALRNSAVWAALRLRADMISSFPVDAYRDVDGLSVEVSKPLTLREPYPGMSMREFLYSTQFDLDRCGNVFGIIEARNAWGLPTRIRLVPVGSVSVLVKNDRLVGYRIDGEFYAPDEVWHEKQYTVPGLHVGLSPVAYAAWSLGEYQSIQEFALDWFQNKTIPAAHLRNTTKTLDAKTSQNVKEEFMASVKAGEVFVTGQDWEYNMLAAEGAAAGWLDAKQYGLGDIARFFNVPADLIDVPVQGSANLNYANITQRNLQLLIIHLGPTAARREENLSRLLPAPRYAKLNTSSLLRMDDETRARTLALRISSKQIVPSEARAFEDLPPFTQAQIDEFEELGLLRQPLQGQGQQGGPATEGSNA